MYSHLAYVQHLMILTFILNRFTAVVFPIKYKEVETDETETSSADLETAIPDVDGFQPLGSFCIQLSRFLCQLLLRVYSLRGLLSTLHQSSKFLTS